VEVSATLTRKVKTEQLREEVKAAVEESLLEILCGKGVRRVQSNHAHCVVLTCVSFWQPREDTKESFRALLRDGSLNQKTIPVDVPIEKGQPQGFGIDIGGPMSPAGINDIIGKMMSGGKQRTERMELSVEEVCSCRSPRPGFLSGQWTC